MLLHAAEQLFNPAKQATANRLLQISHPSPRNVDSRKQPSYWRKCTCRENTVYFNFVQSLTYNDINNINTRTNEKHGNDLLKSGGAATTSKTGGTEKPDE